MALENKIWHKHSLHDSNLVHVKIVWRPRLLNMSETKSGNSIFFYYWIKTSGLFHEQLWIDSCKKFPWPTPIDDVIEKYDKHYFLKVLGLQIWWDCSLYDIELIDTKVFHRSRPLTNLYISFRKSISWSC